MKTTDQAQAPEVPIKTETFLIAEYGALRREIELVTKEIGDYERYAILSSGAIWAWLLSRPQLPISHIACFVPIALSILIFSQTWVLRRKVFGLARYIREIEKICALPDHLGWETQLFSGGIKRDHVPYLENIIWSVLCVANLTGCLLVLR